MKLSLNLQVLLCWHLLCSTLIGPKYKKQLRCWMCDTKINGMTLQRKLPHWTMHWWFISDVIDIYFSDLEFFFDNDEVYFLFLLYLCFIVKCLNTLSSPRHHWDTHLLFPRFVWLSLNVRLTFLCTMLKLFLLMKKVCFSSLIDWEQNGFFLTRICGFGNCLIEEVL